MIKELAVYNVGPAKLRLGKQSDGGYIINDRILSNSKKLITLGYGDEDSFEVDWFNRTKRYVDIYDGTCECGFICREYSHLVGSLIKYYNRNVGTGINLISLTEILENETDCLLKVDIEGGEYTLFDGVDCSKQTGILIEVHNLQLEQNREKLFKLLQNELKDFVLFHVHGNCWGSTFTLEGVEFPETLELSFINKKLVSDISLDSSSYPIEGLDYPNRSGSQDIPLPWVNSTFE